MTEQLVQKIIQEWLEFKGAHVTKYNANGYGVAGHPDLFVSLPLYMNYPWPIAFYIEVKTEKGVLSDVQNLKISRMKQDGHIVIVARNAKDVYEGLLAKGIRI